ncbi:DNA glycosylase [Xylaria bambusicola]|uniref:DNA glycosylase n=1 Tax=Xylaria bambusicola TaxID=326684 RepID=UPI0020085B1C|nr:DNA glycosylase [Xylaria bambusicola]KAI0509430.1 DNA glycosylase [Xylaria bambusicola]
MPTIASTSWSLSLLASRLANHSCATTTLLFQGRIVCNSGCQQSGWRGIGTLRAVGLRGTSNRAGLAVFSSRHHSIQRRELTPLSASNKTSRPKLGVNMSTRRSARLMAASEAEVSSSRSSEMVPPPVPARKGRKRKAEETDPDSESNGGTQNPPGEILTASTKRRGQRTSTPPPSTPTPSNVKMMAEPAAPGVPIYATPPSKKPRAAAVDRLADPNTTFATLLSPETSRVVISKRARARSPSASPTKQENVSILRVPATANVLEEGNKFLISVDPRMRPLVENNHCRIFSPEGLAEQIDPFEALCSGIISQQVSGAAAKSIKNKFINLFYESEEDSPEPENKSSGAEDEDDGQVKKRRFPVPSQVVGMSIEKLRTAGLSQRKAEYVSGLAEKFVSGELSAAILADAPYEEVIERLTAVRGLGLWSAEMFACFGLKRVDVFSLGDLGVQRGMAAFVGRDIAKLKSKGGKFKYMSEADMKELSDKFKPYRTLFMWYMWRVEETDISTME